MGYAQKDAPSVGNAMMTMQFIGVSATQKFALSDLSVTGYTPYDKIEEDYGCVGDFWLQTLTTSGRTDKLYAWYDDGEHTAGWYTGSGEALEKSASEITFDIGQAFWCNGNGLTLVGAGAVSTSAIQITTPTTGNVACGNAFPVAISLNNIVVSGYTPYDTVAEDYGCVGDFWLQTLTTSGRTDKLYAWYDDCEHPAGWYTGSGEALDKSAAEITFDAGQGFWCNGNGLTVMFTCPITIE